MLSEWVVILLVIGVRLPFDRAAAKQLLAGMSEPDPQGPAPRTDPQQVKAGAVCALAAYVVPIVCYGILLAMRGHAHHHASQTVAGLIFATAGTALGAVGLIAFRNQWTEFRQARHS